MPSNQFNENRDVSIQYYTEIRDLQDFLGWKEEFVTLEGGVVKEPAKNENLEKCLIMWVESWKWREKKPRPLLIIVLFQPGN